MEEYITRDIHIINTETGIPSFETNRGRSWIDLTLCNRKLIQNIRRWTCREESCTNHKIICFDIESRGFEGKAIHFIWKRFNAKVDNWGTFECKLVKNLVKNSECWTDPYNLMECDRALSQKVKHCTNIGEVIHKLTSAITAACYVSFQVLRPGKRASKERSVP